MALYLEKRGDREMFTKTSYRAGVIEQFHGSHEVLGPMPVPSKNNNNITQARSCYEDKWKRAQKFWTGTEVTKHRLHHTPNQHS